MLEQAFLHDRRADLFLTVGSSLVVQPAALLPVEAKRAGARLVLVNLSETPLDSLTDIIPIGKAGPTMESLMAAFRAMSA